MILAPSIIYCITEGKIDASALSSLKDALEAIEDSIEKEAKNDDESL